MSVISMPSPAALTASEQITPDDLLKMGQQGLFELVDGELIEKPMGSLSGKTTGIIFNRLFAFFESARPGDLYIETSFRCFPSKPLQVRRPDIAFVTASRVAGVPEEGHVPIRPDLCVEVVSPDDGVYDLDGKLDDYLSAGVPMTWVFNPKLRIVRVFKPDGSILGLRESDTLDGEAVLPGFSIAVRDCFPAVKSV